MLAKVFTNKAFIGEFPLEAFFTDKELVSIGTIIEINGEKFCVKNLRLRKRGDVVFEVY